MIRAIETQYNGYRFRSRLEARWAVFFDISGIQYEYEMEGYDLGPAGYYLPDFYLPVVKMWAEVKAEKLTKKERRKCAGLVAMTKRPCLLLVGAPDFREYPALNFDYSWDNDRLEPVGQIINGYTYTLAVNKWYREEKRFPVQYCFCIEDFCQFPRYADAVYAARSARFEHGEQPNGRPATLHASY